MPACVGCLHDRLARLGLNLDAIQRERNLLASFHVPFVS